MKHKVKLAFDRPLSLLHSLHSSSAIHQSASEQATGTISDTNEDILLVSPRPRPTPHHAMDLNAEASLARARTPPARRSTSPEQVYRGVGKLIDVWQKKSEESEAKTRVGQKPGGPRQQRKDGVSPKVPPNN
ncbi:14856_t:CDS:2 [Acaulospora colombiana]|uniref:14856_t:CDS:1 n=1 Tax=Acaulospora colombiana TaxID=27376 RepID=A0ACA9LS29_9GLOM|nr:14856_t:CDS:2 [Acaulospora colombiana]